MRMNEQSSTGQPLVSIITPSYNHASFLEQTIQSVLAQDYPSIEYIVVDGGSTDGSVEIIKRYEHGIARWVSEADRGQSHAINKGFRLARGDIVAWLNSDDLYFPDAVSTAVRRFQQQPNLGLFYGHCVFVGRDGEFVRYFTEVEPYDRSRLCNCSDYIMQPTTFFRRDVLLDVGLLDESLHFTMDWDLWCRLAKSGCGVHYESALIAATRVYPETKTLAGGRTRLDEIKRIIRRHGTAWWPHAWYGYYACEVRQFLERERFPFFRRLCLGLRLLSLTFGAARNIVYDLRQGKNLYGLRRYTHRLLKGARLTWPLYGEARAIELSFRADVPLVGTVQLAGAEPVPLKLPGSPKPGLVRVPIPARKSNHVIDLSIIIERPTRPNLPARLEKVELV
jgi:glycosyltransferase involved in cell wall biosynthesis